MTLVVLLSTSIWESKKLLDGASYEFRGVHAPCGSCGVEWCVLARKAYPVHPHVGLAWCMADCRLDILEEASLGWSRWIFK